MYTSLQEAYTLLKADGTVYKTLSSNEHNNKFNKEVINVLAGQDDAHSACVNNLGRREREISELGAMQAGTQHKM